MEIKSEQYTVGLVGAGSIATEVHLPAYDSHPHTTISGLTEVNRERREEVGDQFSIPHRYSDYENMLNELDIDILSICSPPATHEPVFLRAAENGCDVYCEKPLTLDSESAYRMQEAAEEANIIVQLGHALRYMGNYQRTIQMARAYLFGGIEHIEAIYHSPAPPARWYYNPDLSGGGAVADKMPHVLDFYLTLLEGEQIEVQRSDLSERRSSGVEDFVEVLVDIGDTSVHFSLGWTHQRWNISNTVIGVDAMVEFDDELLEGTIQDEWVYFKHGERPLIQLGPLYQQWIDASETPHLDRINDFIDHVRRGDQNTRVPIERGVKITELIDEIYQKGGRPR